MNKLIVSVAVLTLMAACPNAPTHTVRVSMDANVTVRRGDTSLINGESFTINNLTSQTFSLTASPGHSLSPTVGGTCPQGQWDTSSQYTTGLIIADCNIEFTSVVETKPTYVSSEPADGAVFATIPNFIAVTFSKPVTTNNSFTLSGTCTNKPIITSVTGDGSSTLTIHLDATNAHCASSETLILITAMDKVVDAFGNAGIGTHTVTLTRHIQKIYVTAGSFNGNLGGVIGADATCMRDTNYPGTGNYKAMVVDGTTRLACDQGSGNENCTTFMHLDWVLTPNTSYVRLDDRTVIGTTNNHGVFLFNGGATLTNAISTTTTNVYTGLNSDWTRYSGCEGYCNCNGFTDGSANTSGTTGESTALNGGSIEVGISPCNTMASLYCVEQPLSPAPTLVGSSPADGAAFAIIPGSISVIFSQAVTQTGAFTLSGTCSVKPTISSVSLSDAVTHTVNLNTSGASCASGETLILTVEMDKVSSLAGIAGSGTHTIALTYQSPPTFVSSLPADGALFTAIPSALTVTFSKPVTQSEAFTVTGTCIALPTISTILGANTSTLTVNLDSSTASCISNETLALTIAMDKIFNMYGNAGAGTQTITLTYHPPPTILSSTPADGASIGTIPNSIAVTFSKPVTQIDAFTITGTCGTKPTISSITGTDSETFTVNLDTTNATCAEGETLILSTAMDKVTDLLGIAGIGVQTVTLTHRVSPTILSSSPANGMTFGAVPSTLSLTFSKIVFQNDAFTVGGTCGTAPVISSVTGDGTPTLTINFDTSIASCATAQTLTVTVAMDKIVDAFGYAGTGTQTVTLTRYARKIFVTALAHNGNLGGITGADAACMGDANYPGTGTYKALVVDGTNRLACTQGNGNENCTASQHIDWVLTSNTTYVRPDDATVIGVTNSEGIFSFTGGAMLTHAVSSNTRTVFTGLNSDWTRYGGCGAFCNCNGFTDNSSGNASSVGEASALSGNSISTSTGACDTTASLYCVEQ